ncbi:hypothetical protein FRB99_005600 [Tulasnella sp. 403]|nr:hypothetical protein FRB99_005600 [Tulasnella sp. 403]
MASTERVATKFDTTSWKEEPVPLPEGATPDPTTKKVTVVTERTFTGRLIGTGVANYAMTYTDIKPGVTDPHQMTAVYSGEMKFNGTLDGGEAGEVVFKTEGKYEGVPVATWAVDEASATGGLAGLKGKGGYTANKGDRQMTVWLDVQKSG